MTLTFNPLTAMVMTYSLAKVQGQRPVGSGDRVKTNGQTDGQMEGGDRITSLADAVGKDSTCWLVSAFRPLHTRQHSAFRAFGIPAKISFGIPVFRHSGLHPLSVPIPFSRSLFLSVPCLALARLFFLLSVILKTFFLLYAGTIYSVPVKRVWSIAINLSVCLSVYVSVHEYISGISGPIIAKLFLLVLCGHGSVFLWQLCDTLCTSSFMDDVTFGRKGPCGHVLMKVI